MKAGKFWGSALTAAAGTFAYLTAKDRLQKTLADEEKKRELIDRADAVVMDVVGRLSRKVSDACLPYLNRYDNTGFLEGNGYFLSGPTENACWQLGYYKESIIPERCNGDLYLGGYLAFPPNKVSGFITKQYVRCIALDDNSGRGIHVFAVIDCVGLANADIRIIRNRLRDFINEKNILSLNISATHCHSGVDTEGLWGDLIGALKTNIKTVKSEKTAEDSVSGRNKEFMDYLYTVTVDAVKAAVNSMKQGSLQFALLDGKDYSYDKRPPFVTDDKVTVLQFTPVDGTVPTTAVFFAAHPTNYGAKQTEVSADFPYYLCRKLEENNRNALYFQGAEAAIAAQLHPFQPENGSTDECIRAYAEALAGLVLSATQSDFIEIAPYLNVLVQEVFIPADNPILTLAGKLKLVQNTITKVSMDGEDYDMYFPTEVGLAEFGNDLKFALIPGEIRPEIIVGGTFDEKESYTGESWKYPPLRKAVSGRLSVIGLCNDEIGYIVPDHDFGSVFAPCHYEESVSAGKRTASNIAAGFLRVCEKAEKIRIQEYRHAK